MEDIIKTFLYNVSVICGSISIVSLIIAGTIRCICIAMDHLKIANVMREALTLYIKAKRPDIKVKDIDIINGKIKRG